MPSFAASFTDFWHHAVDNAWGRPTVYLLIGSGLFFTLAGRLLPLRHIGHAFDILRGRYDDPNDPGEITHFQALSSALAATVGLGNIAGVAVAVSQGGPGAIFWMWVAGLVGMSTKFFTCTLACLYRKRDRHGVDQGGPMYFIEVGLGPQFKALAILFSLAGMIGCLGMFNCNQLASLLEQNYLSKLDLWGPLTSRALVGTISMIFVGAVILGGIVRVGKVTARLVPAMAGLYVVSALVIVAKHLSTLPHLIGSIFSSAFRGGALVGGAAISAQQAMMMGVRRAAFSNEAGLGTAAMAHGAAKTKEPVREGLVAMLGPFIDTNVLCTMTALVILAEGYQPDQDGLVLTANAFGHAFPGIGSHLLTVVVVLFAASTMISYSYYSLKCARYVFGERIGGLYIYVYLATLLLGAVWKQSGVIDMLDTAFAVMSIPTLTATLALSPKVLAATRDYFGRMKPESDLTSV